MKLNSKRSYQEMLYDVQRCLKSFKRVIEGLIFWQVRFGRAGLAVDMPLYEEKSEASKARRLLRGEIHLPVLYPIFASTDTTNVSGASVSE